MEPNPYLVFISTREGDDGVAAVCLHPLVNLHQPLVLLADVVLLKGVG